MKGTFQTYVVLLQIARALIERVRAPNPECEETERVGFKSKCDLSASGTAFSFKLCLT